MWPATWGIPPPPPDDEYWLPTGDIFRKRESGHYEIIDRIKDIYKNSKGQTVAPGAIEQKLAHVPGIARSFLVGDGRDYNVLLIVPDLEDPVLSEGPDPEQTAGVFPADRLHRQSGSGALRAGGELRRPGSGFRKGAGGADAQGLVSAKDHRGELPGDYRRPLSRGTSWSWRLAAFGFGSPGGSSGIWEFWRPEIVGSCTMAS